MLLNINDDRFVKDPDASAISAAVADLPIEEFLILGRTEEEYIQVFHNNDGSFQLEYRNGSAEEHFAADPEDIDANDVRNAFIAYSENADNWHAPWVWEKLEFDEDEHEDEHEDEDSDSEEVEYNGVWMTTEWVENIIASQDIESLSINGEKYARVPFGKEANAPDASHCGDCAVMVGQFHVPGCDIEECARCGGQLLSCECEVD
jgi:hypothetical protein